MGGERVADLIPEAGDDVEGACGNASLLVHLCKLAGDDRGLFRGQHHHSVAGGERRRTQFHILQKRHVEWRDGGDDAERLAHAHAEAARHIGRHGLPGDAARDPGCRPKTVDRVLHFELGFAEGRADLVDQNVDELTAPLLDQRRRARQPSFAVGSERLAVGRERGLRGPDGAIDIRGAAFSDFSVSLVVVGIAVYEVTPRRGCDPFAADPQINRLFLFFVRFWSHVMPPLAIALVARPAKAQPRCPQTN